MTLVRARRPRQRPVPDLLRRVRPLCRRGRPATASRSTSSPPTGCRSGRTTAASCRCRHPGAVRGRDVGRGPGGVGVRQASRASPTTSPTPGGGRPPARGRARGASSDLRRGRVDRALRGRARARQRSRAGRLRRRRPFERETRRAPRCERARRGVPEATRAVSDHGRVPAPTTPGLHCALRSTEADGICTSVGIFFEAETPMPMLEMYTRGSGFETGRVHARPAIEPILELVRYGSLRPGTRHPRDSDLGRGRGRRRRPRRQARDQPLSSRRSWAARRERRSPRQRPIDEVGERVEGDDQVGLGSVLLGRVGRPRRSANSRCGICHTAEWAYFQQFPAIYRGLIRLAG